MVRENQNSPAIWLRSWAYLLVFLFWTAGLSALCLPALLNRRWCRTAITFYSRGLMVLARVIAGVKGRIEGADNLPDGPCIVACEHQSGYENYRLAAELGCPAFVLKQELARIPIIGWYMRRSGFVPIDRGSGAAAMRSTIRGAQTALARGQSVVIFPQGTRVAPGVSVRYRPGVSALYRHCGVPVIPAALNSDYCWGKSRILKLPGVITIRYLPALPPGLSKDEMLAVLRERIEHASRLLPHSRSLT